MSISERKKREHKARLNLILKAGARVFAKQGYHRASMDLIAEEAELGKATLYYYYKSKESLLLGILTEGIKDFFYRLEQVFLSESDPIEKLKLTVHESIVFFEQYPDYFKLYMYLNVHPAFRKKIYRQMHPMLTQKIQMVQHVFEEAQKTKRIKDIPVPDLLSIFGSLVMGMGIFSSGHLNHKQLMEQEKFINLVFLEGIMRRENVA